MMPEWGVLLDVCKSKKVQELPLKVQQLHVQSATFAPPNVQPLPLESEEPALCSIPTDINSNINTHTESEPEEVEEEKEDRKNDFKEIRQLSHEMYEVLRKKQPATYANDMMNDKELNFLQKLKIMARHKVRDKKIKSKGMAYAHVSEDEILEFWNWFINFIPPYMMEENRLNPEYIWKNFDKLVKESRSEYFKKSKTNTSNYKLLN